ncbi:hypothetical protein [Mariniflexile sp. AS56]|uniref:hypothetical protein n=1 Tax=Mariniflexile sp. AS56 TaxID=3063957 RepID=UPI0026F3684B|nr:hypothetical protein [Mariniflexile sp. AS56]MDO7171435.1 hypothetical protein [Mariniflexile sp. AS56]
MKYYTLILFMLLVIFSCNNDDDSFDGNIITLEIQNDDNESIASVLANGESLIVLKASISADANDNIQTIEFNKSSGDFLGIAGATASRPIDENGVATITLKVPNIVEPMFFNAKVSTNSTNYFAEASIETNRAFADNIIIEPSTVVVTQPSSVTLSTFLLRNNGLVSVGTPANFKAFQTVLDEEIEVGRFTGLNNAKTDQDGKMNITFHTDTGDINTTIPVTIRALTTNENNEVVSMNVNLTVNE